MSVKSRFLKDLVVYGFGESLKKLITFLLLPFYTRAITPDEYGVLNTLTTFLMLIVAVVNCGLDSASAYYYFNTDDEKGKRELLFTVFILRVITAIPALLLAYFSKQISQKLFGTPDYSWAVFFTCISIPVTLLLKEQSNIYRFIREGWKYNFFGVLKSLLGISAGILLVVVMRKSVAGAQAATLISSFIVVSLSFVLFNRKRYIYKFSRFHAKQLLSFGFPLLWSSIAVWIFNSSDRLFLLHYKSLEDIGFYSVGATISQVILLINMAFQLSYGVIIFSTYSQDKDPNKMHTKETAIELYNIYLFISIPIAAGIVIFSTFIIPVITTAEYLMSVYAIPFLLFSKIAAHSYEMMGQGIEFSKKTWHYLWITILTAGINISLNFIFIPKFGFIGAAFTTLISMLVYWLVKAQVSQKYFKVPYKMFRILTYFTLAFLITGIVPYSELHFDIKIHLIFKILLFISVLPIPLLLGLFRLNDVYRALNKIITAKLKQ